MPPPYCWTPTKRHRQPSRRAAHRAARTLIIPSRSMVRPILGQSTENLAKRATVDVLYDPDSPSTNRPANGLWFDLGAGTALFIGLLAMIVWLIPFRRMSTYPEPQSGAGVAGVLAGGPKPGRRGGGTTTGRVWRSERGNTAGRREVFWPRGENGRIYTTKRPRQPPTDGDHGREVELVTREIRAVTVHCYKLAQLAWSGFRKLSA